MKLPKKIAALLTVTLVTSSSATLGYADTTNTVSEDKLVGAGRWETAIKVSKKGWENATEAVVVNDSSIADALAATPFAEAKNAPILLTGKDNLNEKTKEELLRLGVKKVYLIGGENTLTKNIENELKSLNIEIDRIQGETRERTALEIAKRLDKIKDISEIAVVNGTKGLADAVSIAAVAAKEDMAIILSNPNEGTEASDEFIKNEDIKTSYVIGGENSIPDEVEKNLPNAKRIEGTDRNETNAKVIETFYTEKNLNNAYVAKDGMGKEDHLIDALAVGVLAAKNDSPVIIVGNKLNQVQKDVTNTKSIKTVTQVGGNGNENSFSELKTMQGVTTYEVTTVEELNEALKKANANDVINVKSLKGVSRTGKIEISTNNAVNINLYDEVEASVVVDVVNGTVVVQGEHDSIDIKAGDLVIEGTVGSVNVLEGGDVTINNNSDSEAPNVIVEAGASVAVEGNINTITVNGKDAVVSIEENSTVSKVEVSENASGTVIENAGKVDKVESNAPNVSIENSGTVGSVSGSGNNTPNIDNNGGGTVNKPPTDTGSSPGIVQNPTVSGVSVTTDGDNVTVTAIAKNYGSRTAKVELLEGTTVVRSEEVNIVRGMVSHTFEGVKNGTYTVKVIVGSANASSDQFVINVEEKTVKVIAVSTTDENVTAELTECKKIAIGGEIEWSKDEKDDWGNFFTVNMTLDNVEESAKFKIDDTPEEVKLSDRLNEGNVFTFKGKALKDKKQINIIIDNDGDFTTLEDQVTITIDTTNAELLERTEEVTNENELITALGNNDIKRIIIANDITVTSRPDIVRGDFVIDGNNKTLTLLASDAKKASMIFNGNNITMKNINLVHGEGTKAKACLNIRGENVVLENSIVTTSGDYGLQFYTAKNCKVKNVTVNGGVNAGIHLNGSEVTVEDIKSVGASASGIEVSYGKDINTDENPSILNVKGSISISTLIKIKAETGKGAQVLWDNNQLTANKEVFGITTYKIN